MAMDVEEANAAEAGEAATEDAAAGNQFAPVPQFRFRAMTKLKQRHPPCAPQKKHLSESSDEEDWTLVMKQKVTILIPPLFDNVVRAGDSRTQEKPESVSIHKTQKSNSSSSCYGERGSDTNTKRIVMCSDRSTMFLDRRMRAICLEKKLNKADGLENWLVSLGLGQFVRVFWTRRVKKFHLAVHTMKKLNDMVTDAVGPRRKLIHAIDYLCEPRCFLRS